MTKKLRQITDGIHQTVYISELESDMMSTAYFYRLHDVYQSSTVYLAFPCNRTKRYEHSYGTMEIAGKMFFSSITNATDEVLDNFFSTAEEKFNNIVKCVLSNKSASYYKLSINNLSNCLKPVQKKEINEYSEKIVKEAFDNYNEISDIALDHYIPPFSNNIKKRRFLYQCVLESIRIVALFHDVGHPPYSHIMEHVLGKLYKLSKLHIEDKSELKENYNIDRIYELYDGLSPFKKENSDIKSLLSDKATLSSALHENVGLKMLCQALDESLGEIFKKVSSIKNKSKKATLAIYYVTVAEFCVSMLLESDDFFISLHRIIDGCLDADRMDYVTRDSINSGVNWGTISYKRMLESCQLIKPNENKELYLIAYPEKMAGDIDDLLITRYKIFARINYHHKSYKTGMILQNLVYELAIDYLKKNDDDYALCPEISELWNCLYSTVTSKDLYIIQWNDSTLISHLYKTLVEVKKNDADYYNIDVEKYNEIVHMLEEFLLNKKHYYPIIKRQSDFIPILKSIFNEIQHIIDKIVLHENEKLKNDKNNLDVLDSILRIDSINDVVASGDLDLLEKIFPIGCIEDTFNDILSNYKKENKILSFLVDENSKRKKTGLPTREDKSDEIFLCSSTSNDAWVYDTTILKKQLSQLQNYCLKYIVYIDTDDNCDVIISDFRQKLEKQISEKLKKSLCKLFPYIESEIS